MEGYIQNVRNIPVNDSVNWNVRWGVKTNPSISNVPLTSQESVLTFRSGLGYQRAINNGGTQLLGPQYDDSVEEHAGDKGHEFSHSKVVQLTTNPRLVLSNSSWEFDAPVFWQTPRTGSLPYPTDGSTLGFTSAQLNQMGASAIAQTYPTKPQTDLMVAIAELMREGLPTHIFAAVASYRGTSKRELIRRTAGDYLNLVFGVSPIVREADKIIKMVTNIDKILSQLVRDSGRVVRRSRKIITKTEPTRNAIVNTERAEFDLPLGSMSFSVFGGDTYLPVTVSQTLATRVWFSGAFQYWIPDLKDPGTDFQSVDPTDIRSVLDVSQGILGLRITPKAAWNLLPFSWLVDWFVNVGDLLENADAMDRYGLVMKYGYVMAEQKLTTTTTYDLTSANVNGLGSVSSSVIAMRKQRVRATPYGFGIKSVDLNPMQMSILAALGLSAGRR